MKVSTANSYNFYLECLEDYSCNFVDIKNDARDSDKYFYSHYYEKRMNKYFPKFIKQDCHISLKEFQREIVKPLLKIAETATQRRQEAFETFKKNPSAPSWRKLYLQWKSYMVVYFIEMKQVPRSPAVYNFYYFFNSVGFGILWTFLYLAMGLLYLFDAILGRVDCCRGREKEEQWLNSVMLAHPELETSAVNDFIELEMEDLRERLSEHYTYARFHVKVRATRVKRDNHWCTLKQFVFKVTRPDLHALDSKSISFTESKFELMTVDEQFGSGDTEEAEEMVFV
mmetsp:Transcript_21559/g.23512  ORF Transcript_21559/g.23512 Transcript_21559/m.23512 type:complete len:284 (-) Transcript_21559:422-1273(-)